jgi:hypothetical protein
LIRLRQGFGGQAGFDPPPSDFGEAGRPWLKEEKTVVRGEKLLKQFFRVERSDTLLKQGANERGGAVSAFPLAP